MRRQNKAFVEKIKAKYKSEPYLQTWGGYDAIRIIAQAIKDCQLHRRRRRSRTPSRR